MASLTTPTAFSDRLAHPAQHFSGRELTARLLCFGIPVLIAIEVPGIGTIYLAELCLIGLLPVLLVKRGKALLSGPLALILSLGAVYFSAQVITDVIRETPFGDYARGWSKILFLLMSFISCYLLTSGNRARILCYAGGLVVGSTIYLLTHNPLSAIGWKFGFAGSTTTLLLISFMLVPMLRSPRSLVGPMIMVALGVFSAFMDFRSWGGILMVSAAFLSVPAVLRLFGLSPKPLSYGRMLVIGVLLLGTAFAALKLYGAAAQSGLLGEKSKAKYETQSALGDVGILLGGRNESLVTVQAIMDSPLIGHGSWAKDRYYAELRQLMLYRLGFTNRFIEPETDLIPTHSHLLGAWVEAGLGGALFWLGILGMIFAALRKLYASNDTMRPYLVFLMFLFIWDILFSPFGAQRRLTNGFLLVAMLYVLRSSPVVLRGRSPAATAEPQLTWAEMVKRPIDPRVALGLSEPQPEPWQQPTTTTLAPQLDNEKPWIEENLERDNRFAPIESDDDTENRDIEDESGQDEGEAAYGDGLEHDVDEDEVLEAVDKAEPNGQPSSDLGAGGATIRAAFRRLRQQ
ncbi:MAG: hypothetical protein ACRBM6_17720 [Geminicoccales bacterium]